MVNFFVYLCCLSVLYPAVSYGANILVLEGVPSPSHHIWIRTVMIALAEKGHNITSVSADIDSKITPNLHYIHLENVYPNLYNNTDVKIDFIELGRISPWIAQFFYNDYYIKTCVGSLESKGLQQILSYPDNFKFDVVLYDYLAQPCLLGVMHKFNYPPLIALTAFNGVATAVGIMGSQFHPYIPHFFRNEWTPTFLERVENYLLYVTDYFIKTLYVYPKFDRLTWKYIPDTIRVSELERTSKIVLVNSHPAVDSVEPVLPNIIPVGGLQIARPKNLPEDLLNIADTANNSLILFSLGTNMRSDMLGPQRVSHILEALRTIPQYTFIWKFESDNLPVDIPKNVHIRAWVPQTEILAHSNTILFITHCGMLSTQEAVWFGVPMLGIPIFGDQFLNNQRSVESGVSGFLNIQRLSDGYLREEILKVTDNKRYRENAKILSESFRDQPELPLNRAVWWIERVIRNPQMNHLVSSGKSMSLFARQGADIIAFITILELAVIYICLKVLCKIYQCKKAKRTNVKVKNN